MSFKFPFTNYHELNLDWILKKVETLSVNAESDANTIATYEERLQTAETQAQNAETSAANAQSAATSAAAVAENALTTANSAQSSADASGALASQAATKADAAQIAADSARQAAETAQATAANFDGRITSAEQQASEALNMAQSFDEQARAAITTANNAANVATEAQASANATALELARQRTALVTIGSQQTAAINSAGAAQVTAINNAGQAVLDSLPADYMNGVELVKDYTLGLYPQIETDYDSILNFDNGADDIPVKELKVNILPIQSGTGDPSPTNIRPISGWTGAEVTRTGKNLILDTVHWNITGDGRITAEQVYNTVIVSVKKGESYTCSVNGTRTGPQAYAYYNSYPAIGSVSYDGTRITTGNGTFTAPITGYLVCRYASDAINIQVERGSEVTAYEESKGSQISVTFPSEAGTVYGGTLTINPDRTGTLVVDERYLLADGVNVKCTAGYAAAAERLPAINISSEKGDVANDAKIKASYLKYENVVESVRNSLKLFSDGIFIALHINDIQGYGTGTPYATDDELQTAANAYLQENNLQIIYPLANPVTYTLTTSEISGILSTLYGVNNVWAGAGNTSLTYRADLGLFITENCIANYTKFAGMIAGVETGLTASKTYNTGDYFIVGQKLYKALTNIATGATFTLGTNCEETTVGAELVLAQ